ncbi:MAG TPA: hypothetical protein VJJ53_03350 [Candidatus Nanoarchaeia archaeon]|nr:hypothetical protein [Candidatus Nanoarchaeia archaeon]
MNKKGQGLPLNVIVIAIIVVVALVVIVAFFLGAFSNIGGKAGATTGTALTGTEAGLAVATCENLCNQAKTTSALKTIFCNKKFDVDKNGDGEIRDGEKDVPCKELVACKDVETGKPVCEADTQPKTT